jgi:hypothetical protein
VKAGQSKSQTVAIIFSIVTLGNSCPQGVNAISQQIRRNHETALESSPESLAFNLQWQRSCGDGHFPLFPFFVRLPAFGANCQDSVMLNISRCGRLFQEEIESLEELSVPADLGPESPTLEEKRWIKQYYGLSIPEDAMDGDIEGVRAVFTKDNGRLHRSDFLVADAEDTTRAVRVAFILNLVNDDLKQETCCFHRRGRWCFACCA